MSELQAPKTLQYSYVVCEGAHRISQKDSSDTKQSATYCRRDPEDAAGGSLILFGRVDISYPQIFSDITIEVLRNQLISDLLSR